MRRGLTIQKRSEVRTLLPMALLTLILLPTFTALHYRATIQSLFTERLVEADEAALRVVRTLEGGSMPRDAQLYRLRGAATAVSVLDSDGKQLVSVGEVEDPNQVLVGSALLMLSGGRAVTVEVALPAAVLKNRQRVVARFVPFLLAVNGGMLILVVVFSRQLFELLDQLLQSAQQTRRRESGGESDSGEDEIDFLVSTVEEALAALASREAPETEELETLQRTLERSLSLLGELSAGVAHEMRNSLATLRGYLTLLEDVEDDEPIDEYIAELRRETDHLKRVLDDFLTFARPGSARMEEIEIVPLAHRAAADPALEGFPVKVRYENAESLRVLGDVQLLERALRNLLHNAAQAQRETEPDKPLEMSISRVGEKVHLTLDDRGPGLPEEIRERLFHPFATRRPGGVGLGLALTRRIVELHRGGLKLEDREGGGTRASLWLPGAVVT